MRQILALAWVVAGLVSSTSTAAADHAVGAVELHWKADAADAQRTILEVTGLTAAALAPLARATWTTAQWQKAFSAVAETGDLMTDVSLPAMAGTYQVDGDVLRFRPAYPLTPGVRYRGTFEPAALPGAAAGKSATVSAVYRAPRPAASASTTVAAVYPSASVVPENLLKFYLHFSAPMSRGHVYEHIQLRDAAGEAVELPFLELDEELWSPDLTRLTVLLDPGRIKRGVRPLEEVGPSLEAGKAYTLLIDRTWLDGTGTPLREGFSKSFTVGPADRDPPDPVAWRLDPPVAGARSALRLALPESLDHALLERVLQVTDARGGRVAGVVSVGAEERVWSFVPDRPWTAGEYRLRIPTTIEDLAGNNIGKPFDVDLFERVEPRVTNAVVTLAFAVK